VILLLPLDHEVRPRIFPGNLEASLKSQGVDVIDR
jgi:hypothetical protein